MHDEEVEELRKELEELYMQGYLDRDWGIGQDKADENAEKFAKKIMDKFNLKAA